MGFDLLARIDADPARTIGFVIGIAIAVVISGSIPITVGMRKGQPVIGVIGGLVSGAIAIPLGCLGGLPSAAFFSIIIVAVSGNQSAARRRRRRAYDYDDDYDDDEYDRRRRRKYDDGEDDRDDRRRRGWDFR
jgi:hypothetical protein